VTPKDIINKYLGVPFKHMGRDPRTGLDCWGLIKCIYTDAGIDLFDLESYEIHFALLGKNYFIENYSRQWARVESPQFMDVVLFRTKGNVVNHAGLVLNESRFIHTGPSKLGVIVSRLGELSIFQRTAGFYRYKHDQNKILSDTV